MKSARRKRAAAFIVRCANGSSSARDPQREHSGTPRDHRKRVASLLISATLVLCRTTGLTGERKISNRFTQSMLGAMVLGIIVASLIFTYLPDSRGELAGDINLIAVL